MLDVDVKSIGNLVGGRDILAINTCLSVIVVFGIVPYLRPELKKIFNKNLEESVKELGFFKKWNVDIFHQTTQIRQKQRTVGVILTTMTDILSSLQGKESLLSSLIYKHYLMELLCGWMSLLYGPPNQLYLEARAPPTILVSKPSEIDRYSSSPYDCEDLTMEHITPPLLYSTYNEWINILVDKNRVLLLENLFHLINVASLVDAEFSKVSSSSESNLSCRFWLRLKCVEILNRIMLFTPNGVVLILDAILFQTPEDNLDALGQAVELLLTPPFHFSSYQEYFELLCPQIVNILEVLIVEEEKKQKTIKSPPTASASQNDADLSYRLHALIAFVIRYNERGFPLDLLGLLWTRIIVKLPQNLNVYLKILKKLFKDAPKKTSEFTNNSTMFLAPTLFVLLVDQPKEEISKSVVNILTFCLKYVSLNILEQMPLEIAKFQLMKYNVTNETINDEILLKIEMFAKLVVNFIRRTDRAESLPRLFRFLIQRFSKINGDDYDLDSYREHLSCIHLIMAMCEELNSPSLFSSTSEMIELLCTLLNSKDATMMSLSGEMLITFSADAASSTFTLEDVTLVLNATEPLKKHPDESINVLVQRLHKIFMDIRAEITEGKKRQYQNRRQPTPSPKNEGKSTDSADSDKKKSKGKKSSKERENAENKEGTVVTELDTEEDSLDVNKINVTSLSYSEFKELFASLEEAFERAEIVNKLLEEMRSQLAVSQAKDAVKLEEAWLLNVVLKLVEACSDEDSFIYLNAVRGISELMVKYSETLLPWLLYVFGDFQASLVPKPLVAAKPFSVDCSLRVGEALLNYIHWSGETLSKSDKYLGPVLFAMIERGFDDVDRLASCLGLLATVMEVSPYAMGRNLDGMLNVVIDIVEHHSKYEVRRGGIYVLCNLIQSLGTKVMEVIPGYLQSINAALKAVLYTDLDDVCKVHAENASSFLDEAVRNILFPSSKF